MKMEGVSDLVNGRNEVSKPREVSKPVQPSPRDIGREFVRQYYTMLSEHPQDVYRFYSHESYFVHDTEQPVQGQQKIQRAIERLAFVNCKARIHTVTGTNTMNNGLVIQVCGELTIGDVPQRRFLQTFILCPQTPKKYYVLNDVFQWLDRAFGDPVPGQPSQDVTEDVSFGGSSKEDSPAVINGDQVATLNGQMQNVLSSSGDEEQRATDISDEAINVSEEEHEELEITNEHESYTAQGDDEHQRIASSEKPNEVPDEKSTSASLEQEQTAQSTQRSWANLVRSSSSQPPQQYTTPAPSQAANRPVASLSQPATNNAHPAQTNVGTYHQKGMDSYGSGSTHGERFQESSCKLFIGNITRTIIPEKAEVAEAEIRSVFEKYGPVQSVKVPQKALDKQTPGYPGFAFITMKSAEAASSVFKAARKQDQERDPYLLNVKLESFGFEGDITVSQQKSQGGLRGQYMHRNNGPMQGLGRGSHIRSGMGARGGGRGGMYRQYGGGSASEYRASGNVHPQRD